MKVIDFLLPLTLLLSNSQPSSNGFDKFVSSDTSHQKEADKWIESFKEFRNAIYQGDKAKAKTFFTFPILNVNNEIWYLTTTYNDRSGDVYITDKLKPFTDKDFDKYFNKIFPINFVKSILKIKTDELLKKSETETIEFFDGKATTYKMIASFDKQEQSLSLNLASNTVRRHSNGEILDGGEFNIIYQFNILSNGQIKFIQIRLAG